MGSLMAGRLVAAGHKVTIWSRTPRTIEGAVSVASPAEAVADADIVITMLRDPEAVEAVLTAALPGLRPGTTVVEMSTIDPATVAGLRKLLPDEVALVDAPVLGSVGPAAEGRLTVLAGGDVPAACREVLEVFGRVRHVGPLGAGAALKLAVMSALVPAQVLVAETLAYAEATGVDREALLDLLGGTFLGPLVERVRPVVESGPPPTAYSLGLAAKDLRLAAHPALTMAAAARDRLVAAEKAGHGDDDLTAIVSPGVVPSGGPGSAAAADDAAGKGGTSLVRINPPTVPPPAGHYTQAIRAGNLLFVSGQAALDENGNVVGEGDMTRQSEFVLDCLEGILAAEGCTFEDVVNIRSYLTDMSRLQEYAKVRIKRWPGEPPTSTTVEVPKLFRPGLLIEVDVVAVIPDGRR